MDASLRLALDKKLLEAMQILSDEGEKVSSIDKHRCLVAFFLNGPHEEDELWCITIDAMWKLLTDAILKGSAEEIAKAEEDLADK
jgi:hypothetical protein